MDLRRDSNVPLYRQLADGLANEIRRGRLLPGTLLPGARGLAVEFGVTRKVVSAALDELCAQGWMTSEPRRGTFVATGLPLHGFAQAEIEQHQLAARVTDAVVTAGPSLRLDDGLPDPRLSPLDALSQAYRDAVSRLARQGLGYGDPRGDSALRDVLSNFVNQARGLVSTPDRVLLTRGSQMALFLTSRTLVPDGAFVAVENPGYESAWNAFSLAGAQIVHVDVDDEGMSIAHLKECLNQRKISAVYTTPHHQYPTTVSLSRDRRVELLKLARDHDFVIIEDDYDSEFYYSTCPPLPLCAADEFERVVYIGSFSKLLAPGVRLGYLMAKEAVVERAARVRSALDRLGDPALERAVAYLIEDGELQRHSRKARKVYAKRRDAFIQGLARDVALARWFQFSEPQTGLAVWVRARSSVDMTAWSARARGLGLDFVPGDRHVNGGTPVAAFRAGYASLNPAELERALRLLAESAPV